MKFTPIIFLFLSAKIYAQEINFKHLSGNDGLSQNFVSCILQDQKGFMWFGTKDGLNRYDGYNFVVYQNDPFDTTTISDNFITSLFEDSRGNIWAGTLNGGLNCFERTTEVFHHIRYSSNTPAVYNSEEIKSITEDSSKNIWIATRGEGVFKLSLGKRNSFEFKYKQFSSQPNNAGGISSNIVSTLFIDSKGVLWLGTLNGLDKFDASNESFVHYQFPIKNPMAPDNDFENTVYSIHESSNGNLWLGTLSGLVEFNRQAESYKFFSHHYDVYRYGWGNIIQIVEDASGKMWLATSGELMRFDPKTFTYDYFRNDYLNQRSLSYNSISSLYIDRTGILWVGTAGMGIDFYDPKVNRFSTFIKKSSSLTRVTGFSIRSILEESEDVVWLSTDVLFRWNRRTGEIKSYETDSYRPDDFGNTGAWAIIKSHDGKIWAATNEGVYCYDSQKNKIKQYKFNIADTSGLPQKEVYAVFEDHQNNIWAATESFFCKLVDVDDGTFQNYRYLETLRYNQRTRPVIYQDDKERFWIGTRTGLILFDLQKKSFYTYKNDPEIPNSLNNNIINSICPDPLMKDSVLWIGTSGGGLNRFNVVSGTFAHFTEKDGLPNNVVYGILPDEMGNLWLSTNKGLSKFNPNQITFRNYNINDGLQSNEFNTGAYYRSKKGELFFGGIKGLNYFYPNEIKDNPFVPQIVLTNLKLNEKYVSNKFKNSVLRKTISETNKIVLSYDDIITFEFAALDYSAPEKNQYAYKLKNFNSDWIYSGTNRTATYTNLPSGEYVFQVKGTNNDGVWNEVGVEVALIIKPPWWDTLWAYLLYFTVIIGGLYLIRRYELTRIKLKNQLKVEKVETVALRKLDQLKSHFFANISHEFRTPLTLILGQVESVMSSNISTKEKGKLQVANRNARKLLTLINQLLDLSKLEAGSMELNAVQHNLISFLKSIFFSFESLAEAQKITLTFDSEQDNIQISFDADKMEKIICNLISNSLKFTPENGEIKITVNIFSPIVEIIIKDTGIGIPGDRLPHIFDRFYQVDSTNTREQEGTGIGLALVKELVELHKGSINVNSKEGEGTEFIIHLSVGDLKAENNQSEATRDEPFGFNRNIEYDEASDVGLVENDKSQLSSTINQQIVLVVEDNTDVRAYISEQLENNYRIVEANNGAEGLIRAQDEIPDLIITDVMMPKMDGYQFAKKIRSDEKTSHIPIIMLTAKAALDDKIQGLETGVDDYLTKPFSSKELRVRVNNLIYLRAQLRKRFSKATIIKPSEVTAVSVDQEFLQRVLKTIEKHYENEQFNVEKLSSEMNMSVSQLNRKLNALVDQPPGQLIRSLRLQRAADLLKQNAGTVAEICYKVGFNDQAYFSRAFKKQFNCSPSDFKKNSST
ncbi:MAG: response regulator [Ignavibacteriaceae bacterium]|nr:response regulator [Ignavibacteriaceae bacterium]